MAEAGAPPTSTDALLGGRLTIRQPREGHRAGSDAVLLAAAAPAPEALADVGAGVGTVGLAIALRAPGARVTLVEIDPWLAALADENAAANGLADRARALVADATSARARREAGLEDGRADVVVTNPPFFEAGARVSPGKARAHVLAPAAAGEPALAAWIAGSLALLAPHGRFVMIHRPEALAPILAAFGRRLGAIAILPIHPRAGAPAHRMLVLGIKGSRAPLRIRPGLALHTAGGAFTPEAEALHRGEALIAWE